jgi:hypothetical protein
MYRFEVDGKSVRNPRKLQERHGSSIAGIRIIHESNEATAAMDLSLSLPIEAACCLKRGLDEDRLQEAHIGA